MNIYRVVSEPLTRWYGGWNLPEGGVPLTFCIAELVRAKSHGQAKWIPWRKEQGHNADPTEMPKMSVTIQIKNVSGDPGIVSGDPECQIAWGDDG